MEMNVEWKENNLGLSGYANYRFIDVDRKFDINKSSTLYYTITHIGLPGISPSDYITKKFKTVEEVKTFAINIVRKWEMLIGISKINSLDELNFCVPENTIEPNCLKIIICGSLSIATLTKTWLWSRKWKSNFENWEPVCFSRYKISHRNTEKCINEVIEKFIEFLFVNFYQIKE